MRWAILAIPLTLIGVTSLLLHFYPNHSVSPFYLPSSSWKIHGKLNHCALVNQKPDHSPREPSLGLLKSTTQANRAQIQSAPFKTPAILELTAKGDLSFDKTSLFIRDEKSQNQLALQPIVWANRLFFEDWTSSHWMIPSSWRGLPATLIVEYRDQSGCFGVNSVGASSWFHLIKKQLTSLRILPILFFYFFMFFIPGIVIVASLKNYFRIGDHTQILWIISVNTLIGYLTFWVYFFSVPAGKIFSVAIAIGSIFKILIHLKTKKQKPILYKSLRIPLTLIAGCSLFYLSILYSFDTFTPLSADIRLRFPPLSLPHDNTIPQIFTDKLYHGENPKNLTGDWLSSDRPPLQTGMLLAQRFWFGVLAQNYDLQYQILATLFQCLWIGVIWSFCKTLNLKNQITATVLVFSIFSGFSLMNSLFTWPKLLAATLVLITLTSLLSFQSWTDCLLPTATTALALLSHGGAIFTLVPSGLFILKKSKHWNWKSIFTSSLILLTLLTPWTLYKKYYNPPGNRLEKWHIAGVVPIDPRSTLDALTDSYSSITASQIFLNKWENLKVLVAVKELKLQIKEGLKFDSNSIFRQRYTEFFYVFNTLGILNIGWLVIIAGLLIPQTRTQITALKWPLIIALLSLAVWILLMFGPGTTSIHQGSYATIALLFVVLSAAICTLPSPILISLTALQLFFFTRTWIFYSPQATENSLLGIVNFPLMLISLMSGTALLFFLYRLCFNQLDSITKNHDSQLQTYEQISPKY